MSAPRFFYAAEFDPDARFVIEVRSHIEIYRIHRYPDHIDRKLTDDYTLSGMERAVENGTWIELQPGQELPPLDVPSRDRPQTGIEDAW